MERDGHKSYNTKLEHQMENLEVEISERLLLLEWALCEAEVPKEEMSLEEQAVKLKVVYENVCNDGWNEGRVRYTGGYEEISRVLWTLLM